MWWGSEGALQVWCFTWLPTTSLSRAGEMAHAITLLLLTSVSVRASAVLHTVTPQLLFFNCR